MTINFGRTSNGKSCSCGHHHGVGTWSPERRAAAYKDILVKIPPYCNQQMREYISTWEHAHGRIEYTMQQVYVANISDQKDYGIPAGTPVFGAIPINETSYSVTESDYKKKKFR